MAGVEIVAVGTELLLGDLVDTNGAHIARALADAGIDVFAKHTIGDNVQRIAALLEEILARADGAILTGGLGPTVDDLTREAVARALELPLDRDPSALAALEERFARLGRTMSSNNRRQAEFPRGAFVLSNPHGSAPGFVASRADGKFVAAMPGVPREMYAMLAERLVPWLLERFGTHGGIYTRTLHTVGVSESELDRRIDDLFRSAENPKIAMLAHQWRVDIKIMAKAADASAAAAAIAPLENELRARIGEGIFGVDDDTLEAAVLDGLAARGLTLATAESITGGGVADALVRVPGASATFLGGVVAYADAAKSDLLGVAPALLAEHGAVSEPVARAMAQGARDRFHADVAVATTGIAGPTGATPGKPLGLVWFGLAGPHRSATLRLTIPGERADIRGRAVVAALDFVWREVVAEASPAR